MCKVYNRIGSLTAIKSHLRDNNVNDLNSVNELIMFQKNYLNSQKQIISEHSILIKNESDTLRAEISELEKTIEIDKYEAEQKLQLELNQLQGKLNKMHSMQLNILEKFIDYLRKLIVKMRIQNIENNFDYRIAYSIKQRKEELSKKINRNEYIISHFTEAVDESSSIYLKENERKKKIIDEINTLIYGAIGEQKVSTELGKLSDDYTLINDFTCSFDPPIFNKRENDYIKSIQIDHILISPAGIFLIETKNWSEHSLNNLTLRSPIDQIKRTSFALFKILNERIVDNILRRHHWGERKISIRNLIVLIDQKPNEEFSYVKILNLKDLNRYIEYFKPCLSAIEMHLLANYLLNINGQ
ncbi:nuclease-related domain-containing protein [Mucilaginibacter sp.]